MKKLIYKLYDKFLFFFTIFLLIGIYLVQDTKFNSAEQADDIVAFITTTKQGDTFLKPNNKSELSPGNIIYYKKPIETDWREIKIKSVEFDRNVEVFISTNDGSSVKGSLRQAVILNNNWDTSSNNLAVRVGRETQLIPYSKIVSILGLQKLNLGDLGDINLSEFEVSFYQRQFIEEDAANSLSSKQKWVKKIKDQNTSGYDLFTPPIIYVHEGKLTTRLPDKEEVEQPSEPFGLLFREAIKQKYPLRLSSWIGQTPYFEDLNTLESKTSNRPVRNRIEVKTPYKRNTNRKPGQPSLIPCNLEDPEKLFLVEHFVVQQHKNPQTGGLRPVGRAMVRDFKVQNPFEINSLMNEVFAGDVTFNFELSLPGYSGQNLNFSSSDTGRQFTVGGRQFIIEEINLKEKFVRISKNDPRLPDLLEESFKF